MHRQFLIAVLCCLLLTIAGCQDACDRLAGKRTIQIGDVGAFDEPLEPYDIGAVLEQAKAGDRDKQYEIALNYVRGLRVKRDMAEAAKWFRAAADQGHPESQLEMGILHAGGHGVEVDEALAQQWFRKAADQGLVAAQFNVALGYAEGTGVEQDTREAAAWYRKAAEAGYAQAQLNLGVLYQQGLGVERDREEAIRWYGEAAERSLPQAALNLALIYVTPEEGVEEDCVNAYAWFHVASQRGLADAAEAGWNHCKEQLGEEPTARAEKLGQEALSRTLEHRRQERDAARAAMAEAAAAD